MNSSYLSSLHRVCAQSTSLPQKEPLRKSIKDVIFQTYFGLIKALGNHLGSYGAAIVSFEYISYLLSFHKVEQQKKPLGGVLYERVVVCFKYFFCFKSFSFFLQEVCRTFFSYFFPSFANILLKSKECFFNKKHFDSFF